jgi:hypothetical protein
MVLSLQAAAVAAQPAPERERDEIAELTSEPAGWIAEPDAILRAALFFDRQMTGRESNEGLGTVLGGMIPGAGWLTAGPAYRRWFAGDRVVFNSSAAVSWRAYTTAQARVEFPRLARSRLAFGSQVRWDDSTQVSFFGEGPASSVAQRSEYRIRAGAVDGYATLRPVEWVGIRAGLGLMAPSLLRRSGTFKRDLPDTRDVFPDNVAYSVSEQPTFARREVAITADTRDFPGHPTGGTIVRALAAQYTDRVSDLFSHTRYEAEAGHFFPLADRRVIVGVHGRIVATAAGEGHFVPLYLQPALGGDQSLRSYANYRFHDRHLVVVNAEARFALMTHLDVAVFLDAGNVAPRLGALDLDRRSAGAGIRLHTRRETFARLDVARGSEGWRVLFRMTEPFDFDRLAGWGVPVPFVP